MKKNINTINRFLLWAGGYDLETAKQCSSAEINRMAIVGTMVLIPAFIGMFSLGYAFYIIFKSQLIAAVAGLIWSIIVLFIDRAIVGYSRSKFNLGTLGRILLGFIIGLFVSEPLLLAFFSGAIQRAEFQNIVLKENQLNKTYDSKVAKLENYLTGLREYTRKAQVKYQKEMDGTGGSRVKGPGVIYKRLHADYQNDSADLYLQEHVVNAKIAAINKERLRAINTLTTDHSETKGFLTKVMALNKLANQKGNLGVFAVVWVTRLFFLLIELIPILMKITPTGHVEVYHEIIDQNDRELLNIIKSTSNNKVAVLRKKQELEYIIEIQNLNSAIMKAKINSAMKDAYFLMDGLITATKKQNSYRQLTDKHLNDTNTKKKVYNEMDAISSILIRTIGLSISSISNN